VEAAVLSGAVLAASLAWGSMPVSDVVIDAPGARDVGQLEEFFGVRAGDTLSRMEIRRGVHALIASRQVEDVVATIDVDGAGAAIVLKVQVATAVDSIEVKGLSRRHKRAVREALDIVSGQVLRVAAFEQTMRKAEGVLRDEGYPFASLDANLDFDLGRGTVAVTITGDAGQPLLAGSMEAPGAGLSQDELWRETGLNVGKRLSQKVLSQARWELTRSLRRSGYWEAEVGLPRTAGPTDRAHVSIEVERGPRYKLELEGAKLKKSLRNEALPFVDGAEGFSEASLDMTIRAVRSWAQRNGRFRAVVEGELVDEGNERVLHIRADFGPRTKVESVEFPGAEPVGNDLLRSRVSARTGSPGRWRGEPVDEDSLAADAASVRATLIKAGYAQAEVATPRVVPDGEGVRIEFPVELGARRTVGRLGVIGVPDGLMPAALPLVVGGPWSLAGEEATRQLLVDAIKNAGYADARVTIAHDCAEDGTCNVEVTAAPGPKVALGRLVVAGLGKTKPEVVEKVLRLEPGSVLSPEASLAAHRRLLALGIFKQASTKPLPGLGAGLARDVVLDLTEAPTRSVGFGIGWDTIAHTSLSITWSELSLLGTARSLYFDARYSSREARWQVSLREPAELGLLGVPVWVSAFRTDETYDTYDLLRRGMWVQFGDQRRRPRRALLRYDYEITVPDAPDEILSELEREHQEAKIASLTPIFEYDSRDDPFEPHRGVQASLEYQNAFPLFDADSEFHKLSLLLSGFRGVGGGVFVASARLGAIEPKDPVDDTSDNLVLPIAVRYFAGGRISHRAFPIDRLGIPGETLEEDGDPIGGAGLALLNLEWRFPVVGAVGGALFVDSGNVWADWRDMSGEDLRWGAGLGVRVATPIGPLRLEYGWKLDRLDGESTGELFFAFGNPF
jgi:outer membrane protein insertion porin family